MNGQSIREAAMSTPRKTEDIATPFWPTADGSVAIADIPMSEIMILKDLAKPDPAGYSAALAIKVLISRETGEPIFSDADRDWLKSQASVLMALITPVNKFFGFDTKDIIEETKKN